MLAKVISCAIVGLEGAIVEQSIIWDRVKIGQGTRIRNSIVANNCHLDTGSVIEDSVLGDNVTVLSGSKVKSGSKIWPGSTIPR